MSIYNIYLDSNLHLEKSNNIYKQRQNNVALSSQNKELVTIMVLAYNRIEKTKKCIESILKYTRDIEFKLMLVNNGSDDGTIDYFKTIDYKNKVIIDISRNITASYVYNYISIDMIAKYFVVIANDIIVTPNWLSNLIKIAESDPLIGMVNPVSSNVSNLQQVNLNFNNYDEMQVEAAKFNVSDSKKWQERLRLITLGTLYKKECIYAIGVPLSDVGFAHNFGDDDKTFRVRRAGYKAILAGDTWIHHDDNKANLSATQIKKMNDDLAIGRQNFREKYFGIDAWDDVNNYIPEILPHITKKCTESFTILGIDVRCGTPILEIKNKLREFDIFNAECCAATSEGKYFIDLQTICGADNVVACHPDEVSNYFSLEAFNYIIIGENINEYPEPFRILKNVYSLLKKGGDMFIYLSNTFDVSAYLNVIGYRNVRPKNIAYNITIDSFVENLNSLGMNAQVINVLSHNDFPNEYINEVNKRIDSFVKEELSETSVRLTTDRFVLKVSKD